MKHQQYTHIEVAKRKIGAGAPCFFIAEVGMNHNGDVELAKAMIRAAAESGADAVKFQIYKAEDFVTADAMVYGNDKDAQPSRQIDMLKPYELTMDEWASLQSLCEELGIVFFATPLDEGSADLLFELGVPLIKVASCDLTYLALIRKIASSGIPTIISTGMSMQDEVDRAVQVFRGAGGKQLSLMQCTSAYPALLNDANVRVIPSLSEKYGLPVGFSDHSKENHAAFAAVALGACAVEKHFTSDNSLPGIDQKMSLNPQQFRDLVDGVRMVEQSLGSTDKTVGESEQAAREGGRRSLVTAVEIPAGTIIEPHMMVAKRPPNGISPDQVDAVVGCRTVRDLPLDAHMNWDDLDKPGD